MLIVILLQAAKAAGKTMTRDELTLGLALCLNPAARKAVLGQPLTAEEKQQIDDLPEYVVGLNEILVRQVVQGLIREHEGLFLPGSTALPYNQVSQGNRDLVEAVVQAIAAMQPADKATWSLKLNARHSV